MKASPNNAPITMPAIAPPLRLEEEEGFEVEALGTADVGVTVDDAETELFTPNIAGMVIGLLAQQSLSLPQHQVFDVGVPSQGVILWLPALT